MNPRAGLAAFLAPGAGAKRAAATVHRSVVPLPGGELPLVIRRHPTARSMVLRLAADGSEARLTLPRWGRIAAAEEFARSRAGWLAAQLAALPPSPVLGPGAVLPFRGRPLTVRWTGDARRAPRIEGEALALGGPRDALPARLRRWLRAEALSLFEADVAELCAAAGVAARRVALTSAKRRWGSCAADGTLRLNWRLAMAPDAVRRSVAAHEVAHLVHFDHGRAFHALAARIFAGTFEGDMAEANAWLRREGRALYAPFG